MFTTIQNIPIVREHVLKRFGRSGDWPTFRKEYLIEHNFCVVCGIKKGLELHHIMPYHLDPALELDPNNVITLCRRHHFIIGHLEDWKSYNPELVKTIEYFHLLLENKP